MAAFVRTVLVLIVLTLAGLAVPTFAAPSDSAMPTSMAMHHAPSAVPTMPCRDPACPDCRGAVACCSAGCCFVASLPMPLADLGAITPSIPLPVLDATGTPTAGYRLDRPPKLS